MKKAILVFVAGVVLALSVSAPAFAEETQKNEMPEMAADKPRGMPMPGMEKKCCSMMGKAQMVATEEGGVIVLAGSKLMKYDADLNLVKEAEAPMPMPPLGGKQCPMMGKMTGKDAAPATSESQEGTI